MLCRTNAEAVSRAMVALEAGRKPALVGGGEQIKALAKAAITLQAGKGCSHPELLAFTNWNQLREYVRQEAAGRDLKVFVRLIDTYGPDEVIRAVDQLVDESYADLILSTAHKAKGREWAHVGIADDFDEPADDPDTGQPRPPLRTEAMLAYVTVTRARRHLSRGGLTWIDNHTGQHAR